MMRRAISAALLVAALFALSAVATSGAFAGESLPEWGKCTAKAGGKYSNSACTKLAATPETQKYEWEPLTTTVKIKSEKAKETGPAVLEGANGNEIKCVKQKANEGEFGPGNQLKNIVTLFEECESLGASCNSEGRTAGIIATKALHGEPGVFKKEANEEKNIDANDLRPQSGEDLAVFSCGPAPVLVRGGVVVKERLALTGALTTNKMLNKVRVEFIGEKPGKQIPSEWTPNGEGITNPKHEKIVEHLETNVAGKGFEASSQALITNQSTIPSTAKVELRQLPATPVENLPEWGKCTAKAGGKYSNTACTKLGATPETQKYEWEPLATAVKITSAKVKESGPAVLETANGTEVTCAGQTAKEGEFGPGNQLKNIVTEFSGCEALSASCNSEGRPSGDVVTKKLHGEPGIFKKEAKQEKNIDAHDLRGQASEFVAEFSCGPAPIVVRGGVVVKEQVVATGALTTNKMLNKVTVEFVAEKPGIQVPSEWTPNGEGITNSKHEKIVEHLETNAAGKGFEGSSQALRTNQSTSPSTVKVELRQCEGTIVC